MTKEEWDKLDRALPAVIGTGYLYTSRLQLIREILDSMKPEPTTDELIDKFHESKGSLKDRKLLIDRINKLGCNYYDARTGVFYGLGRRRGDIETTLEIG